ncbi:MAG: hypothetical protein V1645_00205 [archaeon]
MRILKGVEERKALEHLVSASELASMSTCLRDKCGSEIVKDGEVIGRGYNSPPGGLESQRRCSNDKASYHRKVTDKLCCMHAEVRAIFDALRHNPDKLPGSTLYFARLGNDGKIAFSGKPYCTVCSKHSLDVGIAEFVLLHEEGVGVYTTEEYNDLSYEYSE